MRDAKKKLNDGVDARGQEHRDRMAIRSRQIQSAVADIGTIPGVVNPARRSAAEFDLHFFLTTYFPESTGLSPFSEDHLRVIDRIQRCILTGGRYVNAMPRGYAKTTVLENAAVWAAVYGHRGFVAFFGADQEAAKANIDSIKMELAENDLLAEDFPEVCHAIHALEGKPQRCRSQTHAGRLTYIGWTAETVVLPMIAGSKASGAIISAHGILGASRGMKHKRPDGTQKRPDFVILDDPQTDESARTPLQVGRRVAVIKKGILKMGGHRAQIACVMNATVIQQGDLVDKLLDAKKNPAWQGERIKMVRCWSDAHETLWQEYQRLRETYNAEDPKDQKRAHADATAFYAAHREAMDAGCEVSWEHCYGEGELSAIQHAYNLLIDDGPEVFASECQNEPLPQETGGGDQITVDEIAGKLNGFGRGVVPQGASRVTAFIDVQGNSLWYVVCAWEEDFTGYVIDYGVWPKQTTARYTVRGLKVTLADKFPKAGAEGQIYGGLSALVAELLDRSFPRHEADSLRIERLLIDKHWHVSAPVIAQFLASLGRNTVVIPAWGEGIGPAREPIAEGKTEPGTRRPKPHVERVGLEWYVTKSNRTVRYDTNFWKSFVHNRLAVSMGDRGCLSLWGDNPEVHRMLAEHLTAEYWVEVERKNGGRTVRQWMHRPDRPDNHWLDGLAGCAVGASLQGCSLESIGHGGPQRRVRRRVRWSEVKAAKAGA